MSDEFLGKEPVPVETEVVLPKPTYLLDFKCYERQGLTIYRDQEPPVPIQEKHALLPGDKILIPDPLGGGYWRAIVKGGGDALSFEGESVCGTLFFDPGHPDGVPAEWVALCISNTKALARVDFV